VNDGSENTPVFAIPCIDGKHAAFHFAGRSLLQPELPTSDSSQPPRAGQAANFKEK
jgi:hypothetical protein